VLNIVDDATRECLAAIPGHLDLRSSPRSKLAMISPTTAPNSPRMPFLPGQKTIGSSGSLRHLAQDSG
jgi:hypothetical protein